MSRKLFWGEKGEYGPFSAQEDGWPNSGEVIRFFRRKRKMRAEELAKRYGEAIGVQVTARWILKMEQQNEVPMDITRRRILAKILDIPPVLLGLASLEAVTYQPTEERKTRHIPVVLKHVQPVIDVATYEQSARNRWLLSYTGEEALEQTMADLFVLERGERESSGDLQRYIKEALNSHYQLASDMTRHLGNFAAAWMYANNAVRVTRQLDVNDFLAAALYRRGYISLEWAIFGDKVVHGIINPEPDRKRLEAALSDFEEALPLARPQLKGAIWLEMSRVQGILQHVSLSFSLVHQAKDMVDAGDILADPLEQILLHGALNGLSEGMYVLGKAASLIAVGRTTTAIELLDDLDELKNGKGIARNQARRLAYIDLLRAEASLGTKNYITAATRATSALQTFQDIQTRERIAWINTIYKKLAEKYGSHREVRSLGKMLTDYYKRTASQARYTE